MVVQAGDGLVLYVLPFVTPVTETDGGVAYRLIPATVPVAQLSAGSHDCAGITVWLAPSADTATGGDVVGVPDDGAGSVLVQVMVTGALYQPSLSGARSGVPVTVGGWSSTVPVPVVSLKMMNTCWLPFMVGAVKGMVAPVVRVILALTGVMPSGSVTVMSPLEPIA